MADMIKMELIKVESVSKFSYYFDRAIALPIFSVEIKTIDDELYLSFVTKEVGDESLLKEICVSIKLIFSFSTEHICEVLREELLYMLLSKKLELIRFYQPKQESVVSSIYLFMNYSEEKRKQEFKKDEAINHPSHYGGDTPYEAIKVIEAWELDFCLGNTVKYISRAGKKDKSKELEDLEKAAWYLQRKITNLKLK